MSTNSFRPKEDILDLGETVRGLNSNMLLFDRFKTKRILGRGGMGVVWLAEDSKLKRDVALKFMPEMVSMDATALSDLRRETRNGLLLSHPNVVRMLDLVEDGPSAAIVMEFVDGTTLADLRLLQPAHVFEAATLKPYVEHLLDALEYAHTQPRVVHRDLKPANLMVNTQDQLKVADFGIASCVRDSVSRISLKSNSAAGTLVYVSPQQLMGEVPKPADDIYSFGATLYELLTGKPPFYAGDIAKQVIERIPTKVSERRKEFGIEGEPIPTAWDEVIAACLEKEHSDRPESIAAIREGLAGRKFRRGSGNTRATSHLGRGRGSGGSGKGPLLSPWMLASVGVVVISGLAAGWYFGVYEPAEQQKIEKQRADAEQRANAEQSRLVEAAKRRASDDELEHYRNEVAETMQAATLMNSAKEKHIAWLNLSIKLKEYEYPYGDDAKKLRADVEAEMARSTQAEQEESAIYQKGLSEKTRSLEALRTESAKKDRGAGPILRSWEAFVASWKAAEFNAAYGKDHEALIKEARDAVVTWTAKKKAESPKDKLANAEQLFADGPCAQWDKEEKLMALKKIQNVLKSSSQVTAFNREPDGKYDQMMHEAIVKFQENKELPANGRLDKNTLIAMSVDTSVPPKKVIESYNQGGGSGGGGGKSSGGSSAPEWIKYLPGNGIVPAGGMGARPGFGFPFPHP